MSQTLNRRTFIQSSIAAAGAAATITAPNVQAFDPIKRPFGAKMKSSCAAYSYRKYLQEEKSMTPLQFLEECAKMGIDAAEPTSYYLPADAPDGYWTEFRHKAFMLGLDISGTAIGNTFTFPSGPDREKNLELTRTWIDNSVKMGAPVIRIFAGKILDGQNKEAAVKNTIETTQIALEYAAKKGVFLALENHGGIVAEPDEMLDIIKQIDSPWFGVNFDGGNFHGEDPYKELEQIAPYAINAQLKIHVRRKGGENEPADFDRIIGILAESDYRGYVALEYEGAEEPKEAIPRHMEKMLKALERV
ncbi:MAG: sugar phosphate isomerase/epimerase family protein [Candidatus Hinthialibacter antarcticus]|nr:sugar phosphate isomerase/epimerase family protein [Candidatus Hinthialibacter antarcticus]